MSHVDRNNPRTVAELREHIGKLAHSPNRDHLNAEHSFQLGWIGALWRANRIDRDMHEALTAELDAAVRAWTPVESPATRAADIELNAALKSN